MPYGLAHYWFFRPDRREVIDVTLGVPLSEGSPRAVHAETRTLHNHFRKHLDRPIAAEIRRVRIERAKRELSQAGQTMKDIARNCGLGNAVQMYKIFVRELGGTPSEYRRQRQGR